MCYKMVATRLPPIIETAILSLCVCLPIIAIRKFKWVSSATSRKLLHICILSYFSIRNRYGASVYSVLEHFS